MRLRPFIRKHGITLVGFLTFALWQFTFIDALVNRHWWAAGLLAFATAIMAWDVRRSRERP